MIAERLARWVAGGTILFAFAFVYRRGADQNWDLLNYHYYSGYALLHGRFATDIAAAGLASFLNPFTNVLAYLALSRLPFPANAWVLLVVQLLSVPLLVLIGRELDPRRTGSLAGVFALLLSMLAPLWWSELGTSFYDATLAPVVLMALWFNLRGIARASASQSARTPMMLSGVAIGLATGLKLTNAVYAIGLLLMFIPLVRRVAMARTLICGLAWTAGAAAGLAATAWWNVFLVRRWGSPLFPLYNALFRSPYFEPENFRDMRWQFRSVSEVVRFPLEAAFGTTKTSELWFADARLLIIAVLFGMLGLAAAVRRSRPAGESAGGDRVGIAGTAFLWFLGSSLLIWMQVFAYQRYLIPLELLFGFGIWLLARRLLRTATAVTGLLALGIILSFATLSVPDWGHRRSPGQRGNHFGLELPSELVSQPADYLVAGMPLTYVFPFMHADSRFFRVDFRPSMDALIRDALAQSRVRPVRVLSHEATSAADNGYWARLGFVQGATPWSCWRFRSDVDRYVVCEVRTAPRASNADLLLRAVTVPGPTGAP
jgi:hypothetical protein